MAFIRRGAVQFVEGRARTCDVDAQPRILLLELRTGHLLLEWKAHGVIVQGGDYRQPGRSQKRLVGDGLLNDGISDNRVLGGTLAVPKAAFGQGDEPADGVRFRHAATGAFSRPAFEGQGCHGDRPALAYVVQAQRVRDDGIVEEDLVEAHFAGHLDQGLHGDSGMAFDGAKKVGEAVILVVSARSRQKDHPLGKVPEGGPYLVSVHDPVIPLPGGHRLLVRHVRACAGFTEALAPDLVRRERPGDEAHLLLLGVWSLLSWAQPAPPSNQASIQRPLQKAQDLFYDRKYQAALNAYLNIFNSERSASSAITPSIQLNIGRCYAELGQDKQALQNFSAIINGDPNDSYATQAVYQVGNLFVQRYQYDQASRACQQILDKHPQTQSGAIAGYLAGQITSTALIKLDLVAGFTLNYSSLSAVMSCMLVMAVVMLSTVYPARKASQLAVPDVTRKWRLPPPSGDEWHFEFPFTVSGHDVVGLSVFLIGYFDSYSEESIGTFYTDGAQLQRFDSKDGDGYTIDMNIWLAPVSYTHLTLPTNREV